MKYKKYLIAVVCLVSLIIIFFMPLFQFVPLKMQTGQKNELVRAKELENKEFYAKLEIVLNFYGVTHKINDSGVIFIPFRLYLNKELCWNYSKKAQDPDWHQIMEIPET